jgi:hypothetical protein
MLACELDLQLHRDVTMTRYIFQVKVKVPPDRAEHTYEAEDVGTGLVFALPQGGNGQHVGYYPEIASYLEQHHGVKAAVCYNTALGDKFEPDYPKDAYKWTYKRDAHEIVVRDTGRGLASVTIPSALDDKLAPGVHKYRWPYQRDGREVVIRDISKVSENEQAR